MTGNHYLWKIQNQLCLNSFWLLWFPSFWPVIMLYECIYFHLSYPEYLYKPDKLYLNKSLSEKIEMPSYGCKKESHFPCWYFECWPARMQECFYYFFLHVKITTVKKSSRSVFYALFVVVHYFVYYWFIWVCIFYLFFEKLVFRLFFLSVFFVWLCNICISIIVLYRCNVLCDFALTVQRALCFCSLLKNRVLKNWFWLMKKDNQML